MVGLIKKYMQWSVDQAVKCNMANILNLLEIAPGTVLLDCGCDDGRITLQFARKVQTTNIYGIEINSSSATKAKQQGVVVKLVDLNSKLPFGDNFFDVVCANQIIEHLHDTDTFLNELHRILKMGGYAVISTENLASWHNIAALFWGWQPFSMTNISGHTLGIGNPFSLHRGKKIFFPSWQHIRVFSYLGLKEIMEVKGFTVEKILGAGYYPLPNFLAKLDPRHSAFLTVKIRKSGNK